MKDIENKRSRIGAEAQNCPHWKVQNAGLQRNGKSCRLRWINYLRPGLKRGFFTVHEGETILSLHRRLGNK